MKHKNTNHIVAYIVIPCAVIVAIAAVVIFWWLCRRRQARLFSRAITPIPDEEIESWRNDKSDDSDKDREFEVETYSRKPSNANFQQRHHQQNSSTSSSKKSSAVIVYKDENRPSVSSEEWALVSLQMAKRSMDMPQSPVLARAPNSRPGLTDDTVRGDDAYIPQAKGHQSRKPYNRHRNARSTASVNATCSRDRWYGQGYGNGRNASGSQQLTSRKSADEIPRLPSHQRFYSTPAVPPRMSYEDILSRGGLSPWPVVHKSDIGRAIG